MKNRRKTTDDRGRMTVDSERKTVLRQAQDRKGARLIELSHNKVAIVDAEDYDRLSQYKWCAVKRECTWYAKTFLLDGTPISIHRVITDAPKGLVVHHIDHNGLNNRKSNLQLCTNIQNQRSRGPNRIGSSKYKGVHRRKSCKKFRAVITHNGKKMHLGQFKSEIDAAKAYDKAAKKFFGEFAYLNFP